MITNNRGGRIYLDTENVIPDIEDLLDADFDWREEHGGLLLKTTMEIIGNPVKSGVL